MDAQKKMIILLAFTVLLMLIGCNTELVTNSSIQEVVPSDHKEQEQEASQSEQPLLRLEDFGVTMQEADFLTEEQKSLLDRGFSYLQPFELSSGCFLGEYIPSESTIEYNGKLYSKYAGTTYCNWDEFYKDMTSVFTPDLFMQLNTKNYGESTAQLYIDIEGSLYYISSDRGGDPTYCQGLDRFKLVNEDRDRKELCMTAFYLSAEDAANGKAMPSVTKQFEVILDNSSQGWRISKLALPY